MPCRSWQGPPHAHRGIAPDSNNSHNPHNPQHETRAHAAGYAL
ncbi:hypothetical protein BIFGAL_03995 [Bifidobacterium gallicum DSM 20093 = LMG 11596]|uniref:Uncharacterized protein n=1 Tax=Bifidobacterium gallicum DSM 20093 = LMG 11596 TaxID=561180 RepID=D1NVV1_9BIFI|nr:hypothetical protein BIFGAL_03995 [Bifidobacterium gallicum DSM 20093 = LMG 11596]